jgi:SAM-dependent methyltransferase
MNNFLKNIIPRQLGFMLKELKLMVTGWRYSGDKYYCPLCEHNFKTMLPGGFDLPVIKKMEIVGAGLRQNNICPRCQSTDRDRLVFLYLKDKTSFFTENMSVLHVAPEPSLYKVFSKMKNLNYIAGTKYQEGFYYNDKLPSIDLTNLPYENNQFDFVIANHVLEHIENDKKAMTEIFRVLKPGGQAILQVPISLKLTTTYEDPDIKTEKEREEHFGQFDHVRLYGTDYKDKLEKAGFKVLKIKPDTEEWPMSNVEKFALNKNEYLYIGKKPESGVSV